MISNYLLSFNSENEQYTASDSLITYLDNNYPNWRILITDTNEFIEFFKTDVHVLQNSWLRKLADEIFNIVSDKKLIESVWKDTTINEWYRYAAIKKLISIEPDTYLPFYTEELISGGFTLGGWGFCMISELYDFPNSIEMILKSNKIFNRNNFECLAENACEYFEKYPQNIRTKILKERNYFIRKRCTQNTWKVMSTEEKLYLTTAIIANEYAKFHDVITFTNFLIDKDESKVVFLTTHFNFLLEDIVRNKHRQREGLNEQQEFRMRVNKFDCPKYDARTHQYTPSEQFSRFLSIARTEIDEMPYYLLNHTFQELSHSQHRFE